MRVRALDQLRRNWPRDRMTIRAHPRSESLAGYGGRRRCSCSCRYSIGGPNKASAGVAFQLAAGLPERVALSARATVAAIKLRPASGSLAFNRVSRRLGRRFARPPRARISSSAGVTASCKLQVATCIARLAASPRHSSWLAFAKLQSLASILLQASLTLARLSFHSSGARAVLRKSVEMMSSAPARARANQSKAIQARLAGCEAGRAR